MTNFVKTHPFNFSPYQEDIILVGGKGQGKTTLLKFVLSFIPNIPYWLWDFSNQFYNFGHLVRNVSELQYGQYVIQATDKGKENYGKYLRKIFHEMSNMVQITDELHQYTNKNEIFSPLYELVLSGRNKGISNIFVTTRPASIPNYILSNVSHVFALPLRLQSDVEWLEEYLGSEAWLLLPKDKRKKQFVDSNDIDVLPKYSYIYRNMEDSKPYVVLSEDVSVEESTEAKEEDN